MSIETNSLEKIMDIADIRSVFAMNEHDIKEWLAKHRSKTLPSCPDYVRKKYQCTDKLFRGHLCRLLTPRRRTGHEGEWIFYVHGGGYILDMQSMEWRFLYKIARKTGMSVIIPHYPLAPQFCCEDAFLMLFSAYKWLLKRTSASCIHIIGCSSGGGVALSLAQLLKSKAQPAPHDLILLSPTLNLNVPNDEEWRKMQKIAPHDKLLTPNIFYTLGKWWGGGRSREDCLVSPFYGSLDDIGKISVFTGTHDVLNVSANELYNRAIAENVPLDLYEFADMPHIWFHFPGPESRDALRTIRDLLLNR